MKEFTGKFKFFDELILLVHGNGLLKVDLQLVALRAVDFERSGRTLQMFLDFPSDIPFQRAGDGEFELKLPPIDLMDFIVVFLLLLILVQANVVPLPLLLLLLVDKLLLVLIVIHVGVIGPDLVVVLLLSLDGFLSLLLDVFGLFLLEIFVLLLLVAFDI